MAQPFQEIVLETRPTHFVLKPSNIIACEKDAAIMRVNEEKDTDV